VNSGFYVMSPAVFDHIPSGEPYSNERQLFPALLTRGERLLAHLPARDGYWADVGRTETYLEANREVLGGAVGWFVPQQRSLPARGAQVASATDIGADVVIEPGARLGPGVAVGDGCVIGTGAEVRDSILWPGSRVGAEARVTHSIVAGATVAPGEELNAEVRVVD